MQSQNKSLGELLVKPVEALGYVLWGVELSSDARGSLLRVYIDHDDGVDIKDCEKVSHQVSGVLDVEDVIRGEYTLEVSSPGIYRPLFTEAQYARYRNETVRIKMHVPVQGRKKFQGKLLECAQGVIVLQDQDGEHWELPLNGVAAAHLEPEVQIGRR